MQDIASVLDALCDKVGIAIDWSAENIAPQLEAFVARYGTYLAASSIFGLVLSVLFIAAGVTGIVLTYRSYQKGTWPTATAGLVKTSRPWESLSLL